ncbi:MAG TPA: YtxH domain-containing protein [Bryobacteraceae bacterium]|nr:YtxH domain-containing protein [Bryobacteraceae bacterium]
MAQASGFPSDLKVDLTVEDHMDKNGLSSFLMGLGVGVAIGMLFAPKSGQETRELIKNKAGEGADFVKSKSGDIKQSASEWVDKGKQSASEWVDKGKEAVRSQKENLSDAVEAGKQAYRDAVGTQGPGSSAGSEA